MVHAEFGLPAMWVAIADGMRLPCGRRARAQRYLDGRPIAIQIAHEAFDLRPHEIAPAAGVNRKTASAAIYRVMNRRDERPEFDARCARLVEHLKQQSELT